MTTLGCRSYYLLITQLFETIYSISLRQPPLNLHEGVQPKYFEMIFYKQPFIIIFIGRCQVYLCLLFSLAFFGSNLFSSFQQNLEVFNCFLQFSRILLFFGFCKVYLVYGFWWLAFAFDGFLLFCLILHRTQPCIPIVSAD